jgi:hypothetical protein
LIDISGKRRGGGRGRRWEKGRDWCRLVEEEGKGRRTGEREKEKSCSLLSASHSRGKSALFPHG